jgi:hypothetical protein
VRVAPNPAAPQTRALSRLILSFRPEAAEVFCAIARFLRDESLFDSKFPGDRSDDESLFDFKFQENIFTIAKTFPRFHQRCTR